jgi:phage terminase large subunit GpA-like protein
MYVNISRSKLLINNQRHTPRKQKKSAKSTAVYCNHCGGAIRPDGEIQSCIMCTRELGHLCANCSNVSAHEMDDSNRKSA